MCIAKAAGSTRASLMLALTAALTACGIGPVAERGSEGALAPCPSAPHCVASQAADADHHVDPLRYAGSREQAQARLLRALAAQPRTRVVIAEPGYVRAEAASALLRFVDDLEFILPPPPPGAAGVIELRSSSRIGYYDFGANRKRIENLRAAFAQTPPGS